MNKRKPPLKMLALNTLALLAKAQTLGARRALALMCRDGKLNDGRKLAQHWAAVADAKREYEKLRAEVLDAISKLP